MATKLTRKIKKKAAVAKARSNGKAKPPAIINADMFMQDAGIGVQDLKTEDLAIPFQKVLQKMSPELDDLDVRAGDIFNSVTKEAVPGKTGIRVINCAYQLQYIEWEPRGTGSGAPYKIYAAGEEMPDTQRGEDNKDYVADGNGRYIERTAQHYILVIDEDGFTQQALISMKATQFKKSKQWNSALKSLKMKDAKGTLFTPARFAHIWLLKSTPEENKNGSWHGWEISKDSLIEDLALYQEARLFAESISAGQINVQHSREEDRTESDNVPF
jgi:hypothetical protein